MSTLPIATKLPALYLREIGRIVTHWAYLEWRLHQITYRLLDVSPKVGRIAIREPRECEYLDMICDLMTLQKLRVPKPVPKLRNDLDEWGRWRNWVAHCIWLKKPGGGYMVQVTSGKWPKVDGKRQSRKIMPEGVPVDLPKLREITRNVSDLCVRAEALWVNIDRALQALPQKSQQPSQKQDPHLDHVAQKRQRPRRSSRA